MISKPFGHTSVPGLNEVKLTEDQQTKLKRWQFIYDQLSSGRYNETDVRNQLLKTFPISEYTAFKDMMEAKEVFSTTLNLNKKFKMMTDIQLLDMMKLKASDANKLDEYAKLQRVQNELYKMIPDEETNPTEDFTPRQNLVQYNPSLLGIPAMPDEQINELLNQLKREFNIVDIEYTLVPNATDTPSL
jgi:hypothetical protein